MWYSGERWLLRLFLVSTRAASKHMACFWRKMTNLVVEVVAVVKSKAPYDFDDKPTVCTSACAIDNSNVNKESKTVPCCSTDNEFARSFSQWLQSICGNSNESVKVYNVSLRR